MAEEQNINDWPVFMNSLRCYLKSCGWETFACNDNCAFLCKLKNGQEDRSFFILPFVKHESLIEIRRADDANDANYSSPAIFLISGDEWAPTDNTSKTISELLAEYVENKKKKSPQFGDLSQAVLNAELIKTKGERFQNVLSVSDLNFITKLISLTEGENDLISQSKDYGIYREKYYDALCHFYKTNKLDLTEDTKGKKISDILGKDAGSPDISLPDFFYTVDAIHGKLNNIDFKNITHRRRREFFSAPIPFPLQELIEEKKIKDEAKNVIKLLLIDNKLNKVINKKNKEKTLGGLFQSFAKKDKNDSLGNLFELRMLGNNAWTRISNLSCSDNFKEESEAFDFDKFGKELKTYKLSNSEDQSLKRFEYLLNVYNRIIKEAHFVLLDFFLNGKNTYLAFDFIRDIAYIKRKHGDVSTTWYFITSAVYDSVVKYSQSGLLAEYYESAVVSAGDDPTNNKRQIIFLYKLLTFINARFTNFKRYKDSIHEKLFADWKKDVPINESQLYCKEYKEKECPLCNDKDCLKGLQNDIKRYLTEYDDVCSIFYDKKDNNDLKDIIESLDNVIKQFIWLPEADWYMIQHQIDFINNKLGGLQDKSLKKCKFSCKYILEELKDRSEVY